MSDSTKSTVDLTLKPLLTISAHESIIYGIAYLLGGERLVTCSRDGTVKQWNLENGEQEGTLMEHDGSVRAVAVTKDGKWIVSGGAEKRLRVWDVETHQSMAEWAGHGDIRCFALSPDGQLVTSGDYGGRIIIRGMEEGTEIKHSISTGNRVCSVCFSPNGKMLASGHWDHAIRVFDVESGNLILGPMQGHTGSVTSDDCETSNTASKASVVSADAVTPNATSSGPPERAGTSHELRDELHESTGNYSGSRGEYDKSRGPGAHCMHATAQRPQAATGEAPADATNPNATSVGPPELVGASREPQDEAANGVSLTHPASSPHESTASAPPSILLKGEQDGQATSSTTRVRGESAEPPDRPPSMLLEGEQSSSSCDSDGTAVGVHQREERNAQRCTSGACTGQQYSATAHWQRSICMGRTACQLCNERHQPQLEASHNQTPSG
ncbi:quinon protein alcohol dehydrogenase-like superfamily [Melanogaster broomeanus]|nr:quinon protein alcohol dehydrogenase-like superfamily [Melanogaster broomeanus]